MVWLVIKFLACWLLFAIILGAFAWSPYWVNDWPMEIDTSEIVGLAAFSAWGAGMTMMCSELLRGPS